MTNKANDSEVQILDVLAPDDVRSIGVLLNGGRPYGWRERLAKLTGASAYTIRSWVDAESSAAHRPCCGPAARLLLILADMHSRNIDVEEYLRNLHSPRIKEEKKGLIP